MINSRLVAVFVLFAVASACSKKGDDPSSVDLGYEYFPAQTGATWIYHVDSLVYDDNTGETTIDTFAYEYKEQITGTFTDVSGKTGQYVTRSFRMHDTLPWEQGNIWTILKTELNAQRTEENTRYVKLVFPLESRKTWNGNLFNNLGEEEYSVETYNEPATVGASSYEQTMKVLQKDEENAIEEIKKYEIYARNVGMVYMLSDSINTQVNGSRGYRFRLTLKSYTP
jgi:hypothetical protein